MLFQTDKECITAPLLYESHMHTPLCKHAVGEPEEYAAVAEQRGLKGIIVTCHSPMPNGYSPSVRMSIEQFDSYVEMVERARRAWEGRVDVRLGLESDYFPGIEQWLEELHARAQFHHVLGSVHPQIKAYQARFYTGDWLDFQRTYFDHLASAAETGLYDTISHPDLVKNIRPEEWNLDRVMPDIRRALDRIARAGAAMELNTSGRNKSFPEVNPGPEILREIAARQIPIVIGADAHEPERVGDRFRESLEDLQSIGFRTVSIFLNRRRQDIPITDALASLNRESSASTPKT
ncbi:MAG TPA: histidinol-phosphatase [Armatimonadota bacterium]|nr:histidinol-phosphatase [Armatimonadota bacterium]